MVCERSSQVHAYHDGELSDAERAAVEAHLASCGPCAELLVELRALSQLMAEVPLPDEADVAPMGRYYGAFYKAQAQRQQRSVLRLSGWLTAAAAIVIAVTLFRADPPQPSTESVAVTLPIWEQPAVMPASEQEGEHANGELVVVAQWMADDLAVGHGGR